MGPMSSEDRWQPTDNLGSMTSPFTLPKPRVADTPAQRGRTDAEHYAAMDHAIVEIVRGLWP